MIDTPKPVGATLNDPAPPEMPPASAGGISIERYRNEYEAADQLVRKVAAFRDQASIPANNELRYAGHHFLQAIQDDHAAEPDWDQLARAIAHCQRASYEACDAGVLSALEMIQIFKDDYSMMDISPTLPDWADIKETARKAQDTVAKKRQRSEEAPILEAGYEEAFDELVRIYHRLEDAREDLNKRVAAERREGRRWWLGLVVAVVLGIGGIIASRYPFSTASASGQNAPAPAEHGAPSKQ